MTISLAAELVGELLYAVRTANSAVVDDTCESHVGVFVVDEPCLERRDYKGVQKREGIALPCPALSGSPTIS